MKKHLHLETCPVCDSQQIEVRHDRNVRYRYLKKDHVLEGQEHTVCLDCGLSFYQPGQIDRNNERFAAFEKSIVKGISPNEIRTLREKHLITQAQAARIFNCGETAFSKWERGEVAPTGPTALLLKMVLEHPEYMKSLADKAGVAVDIQDAAPKHAKKEVAIHSVGEFLVAGTVLENAMPAKDFKKNAVFIGFQKAFPSVAYSSDVYSKDDDDEDDLDIQDNLPAAWMIQNFQAA